MSQPTKFMGQVWRTLGWKGILAVLVAGLLTIVLLQNSFAISFRLLFWEMASVSLPAVLAVGIFVGFVLGVALVLAVQNRGGTKIDRPDIAVIP